MLEVTHTLESFANFPGVAGCQTKMLIGYTCTAFVDLTAAGEGSRFSASAAALFSSIFNEMQSHTRTHRHTRARAHLCIATAEVDAAKRVVANDLALAGIMEHWTASVCLFHRMYGGAMHPSELTNLRPTMNRTEDGANSQRRNEARKSVVNEMLQKVQQDAGSASAASDGDSDGAVRVQRELLSYEGRNELMNNMDDDDDGGGDDDDDDDVYGEEEEEEEEDNDFGGEEARANSDGQTGGGASKANVLFQTNGRLDQVPKDEWRKLQREHDPFDWEIYHFVRERFISQLKQFGFVHPEAREWEEDV